MRRMVFIGLGSNIGDRKVNLRRALAEIEERGVGMVVKRSSLYETEPVGIRDQDEFINAACMIETDMDLRDLLEALLEIERGMGRVRGEKNGPRIIDLDILLAGDEVIDEDGIQVPHPRIADRGFVLQPLAEIAAEEKHPVSGMTVQEILDALDDTAWVERLEERL
jgi:2-amino-4-hydroxy-6-hydroxymethyldihydropteridine diphosphokinase